MVALQASEHKKIFNIRHGIKKGEELNLQQHHCQKNKSARKILPGCHVLVVYSTAN
jgi:hypothetical protein